MGHNQKKKISSQLLPHLKGPSVSLLWPFSKLGQADLTYQVSQHSARTRGDDPASQESLQFKTVPGLVWWFSGERPTCQRRRQVWSLIQDDPTCPGAAKPGHHNCWTCSLEPRNHNYWAHLPPLLKPIVSWSPYSAVGEATAIRSPYIATRKWSPLTAAKRKPMCRNEDPVRPKINKIVKKKKKKLGQVSLLWPFSKLGQKIYSVVTQQSKFGVINKLVEIFWDFWFRYDGLSQHRKYRNTR